MAETTPHLAPVVVLLFLGAVFITAVSLLVLLYGAARRSRLYARIGGGAAVMVVACYVLLLCGVSLSRQLARAARRCDRVLPAANLSSFD